VPARPTTIDIPLSSQPQGATLFVGAERTTLGTAPLTATLPISTEPVSLTARFDDGREVTETIVPDRPHPELVFVEPPAPVSSAKPIARPTTRPHPRPARQVPDDRDSTMDPFKQ
jgi:hypothetical protein